MLLGFGSVEAKLSIFWRVPYLLHNPLLDPFKPGWLLVLPLDRHLELGDELPRRDPHRRIRFTV